MKALVERFVRMTMLPSVLKIVSEVMLLRRDWKDKILYIATSARNIGKLPSRWRFTRPIK